MRPPRRLRMGSLRCRDNAGEPCQEGSSVHDTSIEHGPDGRMHVLGWWRTVDRLRADIGGPVRTIDAWVALDVRDSELSPLPGGQMQSWAPRPRRALFHDQRAGATPQPIIPFKVGLSIRPAMACAALRYLSIARCDPVPARLKWEASRTRARAKRAGSPTRNANSR